MRGCLYVSRYLKVPKIGLQSNQSKIQNRNYVKHITLPRPRRGSPSFGGAATRGAPTFYHELNANKVPDRLIPSWVEMVNFKYFFQCFFYAKSFLWTCFDFDLIATRFQASFIYVHFKFNVAGGYNLYRVCLLDIRCGSGSLNLPIISDISIKTMRRRQNGSRRSRRETLLYESTRFYTIPSDASRRLNY